MIEGAFESNDGVVLEKGTPNILAVQIIDTVKMICAKKTIKKDKLNYLCDLADIGGIANIHHLGISLAL